MYHATFDPTRDSANKAGTWRLILRRRGIPPSAHLVCPNGHPATLLDHQIDVDGTVSPSVECPVKSCDFHDNVILDGWWYAVRDANED